MSKWKRIAIGLAVFIVAALDSAQIGTVPLDQGRSLEVVTAGGIFPWWLFEFRKAQFDQNGAFIGCYGYGRDCIVIRLTGELVTLSTAGVHTQK